MEKRSEFEAFKLNKIQMNAIAGGVKCLVGYDDGTLVNVNSVTPGISPQEVYDKLQDVHPDAFMIDCR